MYTFFFRFIFIILFALNGVISAQTGLNQDSTKIFIGSGQNQIIIPILDSISSKNPQIEVFSADANLLEVLNTDYVSGQTFVLVNVEEKGITGIVNLTVKLQYEEVSDSIDYMVRIDPYHNPGMLFQIHDIVFWQEAIPLTNEPVYEKIIQTSAGPYNQLNYSEIPLTVNMDCTGASCTGHDFFTSLYKGYLIPPASGTYHFYMRSQDRHTLWLSPNENFSNAQKIVARSSNHGNAGTEIGNQTTKSAPVELEAGKVYAFYATQWIIHTTIGGILWDGPGINMGYIPGEHTMPVYDVTKPTPPANLILSWRSSFGFLMNWSPSSDNNKVSGYNMYLNGYRINEELIKEKTYRVENLTAETSWQIVVTAVDYSGNESFISEILELETHKADNQPPAPPQNLEVLQATGLALKLEWSGATDNETEVIGYNFYIDDVLYNTSDYIFENKIVIHNLLPETVYSISIEAIDAGLNVSDKSEIFSVSTAEFDPTGPNLGERIGKVVVHNKNTSWNEGIGLNGPYENGDMVNKPEVRQLVKDFQAGAVRWGAISANSKSFQGSVGPGKANTYGKMMNLANEIGAWFALTVGVKNGLDYRTDPNTFLYLLEYLAGDANTAWGTVRTSEGFAEPLLQQGKGILLEFGNEVWGAAVHDAEIGSDYAKYAKWVRDMTEVVRSSPYYDPEKIIMVYSGRYPHPDNSYGVNTKVLTGDKGHAECLGVSGYMGGNLSYDPEIPKGESELDYYKNSLEMSRKNIEGFVLTMKEMLSLTGTLKTFYLYESNMTTTSYNGRFGQAIVLTDYLANSMNYGTILPSIFHLTGGQWRITQPAENYKQLPLYHTGKYFNRFCKGHILGSEFISNNKITDSNNKIINYDAVGVYAYNSGEQFSILMMNRDFENDFTIQLELPAGFDFSENATVYTIWQEDFSSFETNIDSTEVTLSDDLLIRVPKHAMVIVSIEGEDPGYEQLPLGYYDRVRPESLNVTSTRNFIIDANLETDIIRTEILPSNAFSTVAILDVTENTTESILTPLSGGRLHIKASGICGDEGYIKIHAYAADNHALSDTVTVLVTNQGTDCPSTSAKLVDINGQPLFYPNPATEKIYFSKSLDSISLIEIFDYQGKKVFQTDLRGGHEISVEKFQSGFYVIGLIKPDGTYLTGKMQKN
ncbi:T9SS type A sorting domain-containing protein [Mariniphaga sp.]|uniref:T9SS type A sorting domain-containing protein n=1 Tax=Mariniphaga sp. TaxID=1954475 RepID=UPI0035647C2E